MMRHLNTDSKFRSLSAMTLAAALGLVALTGCATDDSQENLQSGAENAPQEQQDQNANDGAVETDDDSDGTTEATDTDSDDAGSDASSSDEDPVFAVIDAVLNEYPGGYIIDIDREDDNERNSYDIDVVSGGEEIELEVTVDGTVVEEERESVDDDISEPSTTVADAIRTALEQHGPEAVLDEAEYEEDDGRLTWKIELDDQSGNTLAELHVPADS